MMTGKDSQSPLPLAPAANGTTTTTTYSRSDEEAATLEDARELRRKKRIKYLLYFIAFVIFQSAVIAIFTLTIMKVRTPRFRVRSATFDRLNVDAGKQSFDLRMNVQLGVKNANFGKYKYQNTIMYLFYGDTQVGVGEVIIPKSSVGWRSTKKFNVVANIIKSANVPSNPELQNDLSRGVLRLTSKAEMKGKVALTFIFNKKKSTKMSCTMDVAIEARQLVNISCE